MPRTSAKQIVLRDTAVSLAAALLARRRLRRVRDQGARDDDSSSESDTSLGMDSTDLDDTDDSVSSVGDCSILTSEGSSDEDSPDEFDPSKQELLRAGALLQSLARKRVINERRAPRKTVRLYERLERLRESGRPTDIQSYRHLVRMLPPAFDAIVKVLSVHRAFKIKHPRRPGASVAEQVAVALYWLGRCGNGGGVVDVALTCGCAEGSVTKYTARVVEALYDARAQVLCWASEQEKEDARAWVARRTGCVEFGKGWSMVDGSQIPLAFKPGRNAHHREYFDRKGQYALNLQVTVLPTTLRIIDFVAGYKGAAQDSRAFAASDVVKQPLKYLDEGDFIWTDGGYGLSSFTCGPYDHVVAAKSPDFRAFNGAVSNVRVRSEHGFGYLKGRFQSLRGLRVPINSSEDHHKAVRTVVAALVAHNIALRWDGEDERSCFMDLSGVSPEAQDAWLELQYHDDETERREIEAWSRRVRAQRRRERDERKRTATMSQSALEEERRTNAKEMREQLHCNLFAALGRSFTNTSRESRLKSMTKAEYIAFRAKQLAAAAARRAARSERGRGTSTRGRGITQGRGSSTRRRGTTQGRGSGTGRGRGRGRGRGGGGNT